MAPRVRRAQRLAARALVVLLALLAGCTTPPPAAVPPAPAAVAPPAPAAGGRVLGQSERFVIYQPAAGDTIRSIAQRFLGHEARDWVIADFNALPAGTEAAEPNRALVVPLQSPNATGVGPEAYQTVPILCYHRFGSGTGRMVISASSFAQQMDWLARNDYRVIPLSQLTAFLEGRRPLPQRAVVITIDDGYESVHRIALPLLRKYGFPATLFVYTDFIGSGDALSWAQVQDLVDSGLVDVQAHSKSHSNLIDGTGDPRYAARLDQETRTPRELLERRLGRPVQQFAYPYGDANQAVLDTLVRHRYQLGLTVNPGGNAFFAQPLMLRRTMVYGDQDLASFKAKLQTARGVAGP
jgi:peptidoglycan/xylan/chitin deacetylase (PgdA/CDA1 family)